MNLQSLNKQRLIIIIAALVGVVGMFLPWVSTNLVFISAKQNGMHGGGIFIFISFLAVAIIAVATGKQQQALERTMWMISLLVTAISLLILITYFFSAKNELSGGMGLVESNFSIGIWITLAALIAIIVAAWMYRSPGDDLKSGFDSLKKHLPVSAVNGTVTATPSSPAAGNDLMARLDKINALREKGMISDEEYQALKAEIFK
jgi:hypothetical protein